MWKARIEKFSTKGILFILVYGCPLMDYASFLCIGFSISECKSMKMFSDSLEVSKSSSAEKFSNYVIQRQIWSNVLKKYLKLSSIIVLKHHIKIIC